MDYAPRRPLIGVTGDIEPVPGSKAGAYRVRVAGAYLDALARAGGVPVVMYAEPDLAVSYARSLDGFLLTGGNDPDTTQWEGGGVPMHPMATPMHPQRQRFELAMLKALDDARDARSTPPTLGVCLGMQLMGVHRAGIGALVQHLPDVIPTANQHGGEGLDSLHPIAATADWARSELAGIAPSGAVASHHHQAVTKDVIVTKGRLRVLATSFDGVVEAFDDPSRPFYVGVQWHPERTPDEGLGQGVIDKLVEAARRAMERRGATAP
ncbi:MAG TPA: gamma-glutamyl-gamma-aminobutyrate hydrolase family protein [Phycisphaerales bacterium]|nr:gamma-glutamyl-gamma-aminobutyrate hydrolase family protein [Phycisphaerales bacterium]